MILSFRCRQTERIFRGQRSRQFPASIQCQAARKLEMLAAATELASLRIPTGNRLEALRGERRGQHSIRINAQWRICFIWGERHAEQVEIVDYHD
ncbi:MAG: type II toxin-antitoxin system RelE/ParE family toxin [Polyangiales bacterium]